MPGTYDAQIITVRQVNALNYNNSVITAQRVLTTDGAGGTYWAAPSNLGGFGAVNELVVNSKPFVADLSYNKFYISTAQGIGCVANSTTKLITLYSKCFDTIDISGGNTIKSYSNSVLSPTFKLVGGNGIRITSDPLRKEIFIQGQVTTIASGLYGYNRFNIIPNSESINDNTINTTNKYSLTAMSPASVVTFAGIGDIILSTNVTQGIVFVGISSFTSKGYNDLSGVAYGNLSSCLSTVSTLFLDRSFISTTAGYITSSIISTTSSLNYKIDRTDSTIQNSYTNIDLFKLLSTHTTRLYGDIQITNSTINRGLLSTISFASSLNVNSYRGILTGNVDINNTYTISSASFRLDSLSTMIKRNPQISLAYTPSLRFDFNVGQDTLFYISTIVVCGNENFPETTFVRPWLARAGVSQVHLYTDSIYTTFSSELVNNVSLMSTYTFLHKIDGFTNITYDGPMNCNADFLVSGNNTLSVILSGTNYMTIN